jgi:hypothetical protein
VAGPLLLFSSKTNSSHRARGAVKAKALGSVGSRRASRALHPCAMHNPSVEASPNSYACKARIGHIIQRPLRALHAPLSGPPHLER